LFFNKLNNSPNPPIPPPIIAIFGMYGESTFF